MLVSPKIRSVKRIFLEAVVIGFLGFGIALLANAVSPRGLSLRRDYFPPPPDAPVQSLTNPPVMLDASSSINTNQPPDNQLATRLAARGLRLIDFAEVRRLYQDPRREQELVVFVDARNESLYLEGHIPGAYPFDHYYPDKYLPAVVPACQQAETVVVYCIGGDCEDSEFASVFLIDAGVPSARLNVYAGGIDTWKTNGMPVEIGQRGSGELRTTAP